MMFNTKHRTEGVLETVDEFFNERLAISHQASRMADIWPIEKVWGYLNEKMKGEEFKTVNDLKQKISELWKEITPEMCNEWITHIPVALSTLIKMNGAQIHKEDCQKFS